MVTQQSCRCPKCHEVFLYDPSERASAGHLEAEVNAMMLGVVVIDCFHCPAALLLRPSDGTCVEFSSDAVAGLGSSTEIGSIVFDKGATEEAKKEVENINVAGDELTRSGKPKDAIALFDKALSIRKHDPQTWYNKGVCLNMLGSPELAISAFQHVTELEPGMVQAWNNLGSILCQAGRIPEGEAVFDRALKVDPDYPKFYLGKANCLLMRGETRDAARMLYRALDKDPNYAPARQALIRLGLRPT